MVIMLSRMNNTIYKYYLLTLVFILSLFKRTFPKWLREEAKKVVRFEPTVGQAEKYVR